MQERTHSHSRPSKGSGKDAKRADLLLSSLSTLVLSFGDVNRCSQHVLLLLGSSDAGESSRRESSTFVVGVDTC